MASVNWGVEGAKSRISAIRTLMSEVGLEKRDVSQIELEIESENKSGYSVDDLVITVLNNVRFSSMRLELEFLIGIPSSFYRDTIIILSHGANRVSSYKISDDPVGMSIDTYSVMMDSILLSEGDVHLFRKSQLKLASAYFRRSRRRISGFSDVSRFIKHLTKNEVPPMIWHIKSGLVDLRRDLLLIIGPEFLTSLCRVSDLNNTIEKFDIDNLYAVAPTWRASGIVARLLWLRRWSRTSGAVEDADTAAIWHFEQAADPTMQYLVEAERTKSRVNIQRKWDRLDGIIARIHNISMSARQGDTGRLPDQIIELYNFDPGAFEYVDWTAIYYAFRATPRQTSLKMAFVNLLLGMSSVRRRHRVVQIAAGEGAWNSALISVISEYSGSKLDGLVAGVREFEGASRILIVESLLQNNTVSILANAINHSPDWIKPLMQSAELRDDAKLSALRSDLSAKLANAGCLVASRAKQISADEDKVLGILYLRRQKMRGTLKIEWDRIVDQIRDLFGERILFAARLMRSKLIENTSEDIELYCRGLAEQIVSHILIDGADNVKTAVSDGLRHNQLTNHYISAFQEAVAKSSKSEKKGQRPTRLQPNSSSEPIHNDLLNELHDDLTESIKSFNHQHLSVDGVSEPFADAITEIYRTISSAVADLTGDRVNFVLDQVVAIIRVHLENFLSNARDELSAIVAGYNQSMLRRLVVNSIQSELDIRTLRELLPVVLENATTEARTWIAVADPSASIIQFRFSDLVQLIALSHRQGRSVSVSSKVARISPNHGPVLVDEFQVKGEYYHALESICRNLMANAFAHSGLGRQTRVELELQQRLGEVVIVCRSSLSQAKFSKLKSTAQAITQLANKPSAKKAAEDSGSGFQKIVQTVFQKFGAWPVISVKVGRIPNRAEVSVRVSHNRGSVVFEEIADR